MPFMIGKAPIRRTYKYLEAGKIILRESVKIFSINYNTSGSHHKGARDFVFWFLPQIQYKNPNVQCITFRNLTPSPFIKVFFEDGKTVLIDIDSREKEAIADHIENFAAICKQKEEIKRDEELSKRNLSPAYFGYGCEKHCMCEILGQVPCSSLISVPKIWRGIQKNSEYRVPPCFMKKGLEDEERED